MAKLKRKSKPTLPSLASLQSAPPEIRLVNGTAMKSEWVDIEDIRPNASRTARTITGWRGYDALRKCYVRSGSQISTEHIVAADRLRRLCDGCVIGFSGRKDFFTVQQIPGYGPISGYGNAAIRSARSWPAFRRAMALYDADERQLVTAIVLLNMSVRAWCIQQRELGQPANPAQAMQSLVRCLDRLAEHFEAEVGRELGHGVVV